MSTLMCQRTRRLIGICDDACTRPFYGRQTLKFSNCNYMYYGNKPFLIERANKLIDVIARLANFSILTWLVYPLLVLVVVILLCMCVARTIAADAKQPNDDFGSSMVPCSNDLSQAMHK